MILTGNNGTRAASSVLSQAHPLIQCSPLSAASSASKAKAARIDEALLPLRPRPQTSMVLARRLLSGALGVRVNLPREEREREARTIKQAKGRVLFLRLSIYYL